MNSSQDIINAVQNYIDTDATDYAIAIDGEWGSGKTHLVKESIIKAKNSSDFLYVSLFGLSSKSEIENAILSEFSNIGSDEGGLLSGFLNSNSELTDDIKVGGTGYAAMLLIKKAKERSLKKAKKLTLCFDDLERWHGDLDICIGYINKLAEHEKTKCIIIGDLSNIEEDKLTEFKRARTKTIRYVHKLSHTPKETLEISIKNIKNKDEKSKNEIQRIINQNIPRISYLLESIDCQNIRTITDALEKCTEVASSNPEKFNTKHPRSIDLIETIIAASKLLQDISGDSEAIEELHEYNETKPQTSESTIHKKYIGDEEKQSRKKTRIKRLTLSKTLYSESNNLKPSTILRFLISGIFRKSEFEDLLREWEPERSYETYLDPFKFLVLNNEKSTLVFEKAFKEVFTDKIVKHPSTLLRFSDRLTSDIKRGAINYDHKEIIERLLYLFEELYKNGEMTPTLIEFNRPFESYKYCEEVLNYVKERNNAYYTRSKTHPTTPTIWREIERSPAKILEILESEKNKPIFAHYEKVEDVISALECLDNEQLLDTTRWMGSRLESDKEAVDIEHTKAKDVADKISEKYRDEYSVRASHFKQISRILRHKKTDYHLDI